MTPTILLFGLAAAVAEVLGGVLIILRPVWPKRVQETLLALGAGFIIALAFFKLIPVSIATVGESAALYLVIGFSLIHFFEHTLVGHLHFGEETHSHVMVSRTASVSTFVGLAIHAFFDGFSISVGLQFDFLIGILVFGGILLHKLPEGLTIGSVMLAGGFSKRTVLLSALGIGIATILGACSTLFFSFASPDVLGLAFAISAGAAVYVGASDLIPEINKSEHRLPPFIVFFGMMLFYASELLLERFIG
ncbi:MAG: ZIP family metal transporter [Ignavibacteriae bacterium]|nr:ZIP family metal transporter [Ignavibacteriota bacterium]